MAGISRGAGMGLCQSATLLLVLMSTTFVARAQVLTTDFYDESCPSLFSIVKQEVQKAVKVEKRMAASLVRLHFHDCFVNGCDGSILLDDSPTIESEKFAAANINSARGYEVIDTIKTVLECSCPNTVSCADILAIASRDSAVEAGLTNIYSVLLGRRDSLTASRADANTSLPSPRSNFTTLVGKFNAQGLNETDLVALSGAHTIGRINCTNVRNSFTDTNINAEFRIELEKACNETIIDPPLQNMDHVTPDVFDNSYYENLRRGEGMITSDQTLQSTPGDNVALVEDFALNKENFFLQFGLSTIKMGNNKPLTGDQGEIRKNCRVVNSVPADLRIAYE